MTGKPFTSIPLAALIVAGLSVAGCDTNNRREAGNALLTTPMGVLLLPVVIAAAVVTCAGGGCKGQGNAQSNTMKNTNEAWVAQLRSNAENGDAQAQLALADAYFNGFRNLKQDDDEAATWYRRAAEGGNADAQYTLATLYEWGRGVAPDDVQADMWHTITISTLKAKNFELSTQRWTESRDDLERRMTPEQIAEARRRAAEWKPSTTGATGSN